MSGSTIDTNIPSLTAQHNYARASDSVAASMQKLATGSRINRGADDPAGLITSESLAAALASLDAESQGMQRTDAVANVADGALAEVSGLLSDANAATVANANTAGMSRAERDANQMEIDSALQSVDRIAGTTTFNGQRVLDGSMTLSAGGASVAITSVSTGDIGQVAIGGVQHTLSDAMSGGSLDPAKGDAQGAQSSIAAAISQVATLRGQIGAFQKDTIGPLMRSNAAAVENTAAANSSIRDTDYAAEAANLAREQVLQRSGLSVLALANSAPQNALRLLG
jgi:flagellin